MIRAIRHFAIATALAFMFTGGAATAQKVGGVLRVHLWDSPPNLSMLDGANPLAARTLMPVFNNLVMFDQHAKQSRIETIVPDLAASWAWNEDGTELTFRLKRQQPAFLMLIADGLSPIYPCHVPPAQMRQRPIGTGPFKFVEFKPSQKYLKFLRQAVRTSLSVG